MDSIPIREAKAKFSALIEAAEQGRPTTITRHGKPAAVLVPVEDAPRLYAQDTPSFADLLLAPGRPAPGEAFAVWLRGQTDRLHISTIKVAKIEQGICELRPAGIQASPTSPSRQPPALTA